MAGWGLCALGAAVACAVARVARPDQAADVPVPAAMALCWSAGVMVALGGGLGALDRDRTEGITALLRARGIPARSYVGGRAGGLSAAIALGAGGATLACGVVATAVAQHRLQAIGATFAALAYVLAFAATLGPIAMAALGAGRRGWGYLAFITVLVAPEASARWTRRLLPSGWQELTSIPAALEAVQAGVLAPGVAGLPMIRALAALVAVALASLALARASLPRSAPEADA